MRMLDFLFREGGPFELAIGICGAILLFVLVLSIANAISKRIRAKKRAAKKSELASTIRRYKAKSKKSIIPPAGSKVYLFSKEGKILHESDQRLTKEEIRNLGGDGTIIAMNEKIARIKWERLFGIQKS